MDESKKFKVGDVVKMIDDGSPRNDINGRIAIGTMGTIEYINYDIPESYNKEHGYDFHGKIKWKEDPYGLSDSMFYYSNKWMELVTTNGNMVFDNQEVECIKTLILEAKELTTSQIIFDKANTMLKKFI